MRFATRGGVSLEKIVSGAGLILHDTQIYARCFRSLLEMSKGVPGMQ